MARLPSLTSHRAARQRGLSLIELVVFIVVVAIGLTGILSVLILTSEKSADPIVRKQGIAVAEAMLEEVLLKDFANPVCLPSCIANTPADRPNYTAVDHYNGWNQTGVASLADPLTTISGLGNYTVTVAVAGTTDLTGIGSANAKKITVTVTSAGGTFILDGYRTGN
jgi:MSHA pilin protein MshD